MESFRSVNGDDVMSSWIRFREDELLCCLDEEDKKHTIDFDKICEGIKIMYSKNDFADVLEENTDDEDNNGIFTMEYITRNIERYQKFVARFDEQVRKNLLLSKQFSQTP